MPPRWGLALLMVEYYKHAAPDGALPPPRSRKLNNAVIAISSPHEQQAQQGDVNCREHIVHGYAPASA